MVARSNGITGCRGATIVEFAIVLPVFMLLLLGIIDFGRYFFVQHTLQYATREGTRLALVGGTLNDPQGNALSRAGSIVKMIRDNAGLALDPQQVTISIFPITSAYADPTGWQGQQDAGNPGDYMRVRTLYTYVFLTPFIGQFFPSGQSQIRAEATYRNEMF